MMLSYNRLIDFLDLIKLFENLDLFIFLYYYSVCCMIFLIEAKVF